ncbi:MAG: DUF3298 domain-containing protein [Neisseriaceae bacterium]|nr:DUF3298 domain-containing protein [Neisseriaceae bacterium]
MFAKTALGLCLALACVAIQAAPLSFETNTIEAKSCFVGKDKKEYCHTKTVAHPITGDKYLDDHVKKTFDAYYVPKKSLEIEWQNDESVQKANQYNKENGSLCVLNHKSIFELVGFTPNYAVFALEDRKHDCNSNGFDLRTFLVFPRNTPNPQEQHFDDIQVQNHQKDTPAFVQLMRLQKEELANYLKTKRKISEKKYMEIVNDPTLGSTMWRFSKDSIVFLFHMDIYEFEPNNFELSIPIKDLQGIIKPEILRETEQYTPLPEKK